MARDFEVTVLDPARAAVLQEVLGTNTVYVQSPVAEWACFPSRPDEQQLIYVLDADELTAEQRTRLVAHLASQHGYDPATAAGILAEEGLPILADATVVTLVDWPLGSLEPA